LEKNIPFRKEGEKGEASPKEQRYVFIRKKKRGILSAKKKTLRRGEMKNASAGEEKKRGGKKDVPRWQTFCFVEKRRPARPGKRKKNGPPEKPRRRGALVNQKKGGPCDVRGEKEI